MVHLHTRNQTTGEPDASLELMRETVAGIRERCDVICCVTTGASQMMSLDERLAPIPALQPELASCNAGSMNFVLADIAKRFPTVSAGRSPICWAPGATSSPTPITDWSSMFAP